MSGPWSGAELSWTLWDWELVMGRVETRGDSARSKPDPLLRTLTGEDDLMQEWSEDRLDAEGLDLRDCCSELDLEVRRSTRDEQEGC